MIMSELTLQEAALAWAHGKRVEAVGPSNTWGLIQQVGSSEGMWQPGVFSGDSSRVFCFRLAPEPTAKRYRPWKPEEVPVGALIQHGGWIGSQVRYAICGVERDQIVWMTSSTPGKQTLKQLVSDADWRHSTDNGKTWLPCGVEVNA